MKPDAAYYRKYRRDRKRGILRREVRERKARQERMLQAMRESGELEGKALPVFLRRQAE